jgi:hypothetical protein
MPPKAKKAKTDAQAASAGGGDLADGESKDVPNSKGDGTYTLKNEGGGVLSCSCPAWQKQSAPPERRTCKHLKELRGDAAEAERIAAAAAAPAGSGASPAKASVAGAPGDDSKVYGWAVEYAKSGRSKCQITSEPIEQGAVRIGKEVDNPFHVGSTMTVWHKVVPLFASFRKGAADKPRVASTDVLKGFGELKQEDQEELDQLIEEDAAFRAELARAHPTPTPDCPLASLAPPPHPFRRAGQGGRERDAPRAHEGRRRVLADLADGQHHAHQVGRDRHRGHRHREGAQGRQGGNQVC